jgi:adenylate cyclase class 2
MSGNKLEQEVKFCLGRPAALEERLQALGAVLVQERTFELNLRFDNPAHQLSNAHQVLRLRQDSKARLTFKGPGDLSRDICAREELEVTVSDLATARSILEALGYHVAVIYEKYRAAYTLGDVEVSLDEMPFGNFSEVEGPDEASIRTTAEKLGLKWEAHSNFSYLGIFNALKEVYKLDIPNLTFEAFKEKTFDLEKIGLQQAD